MFDTTVSLSEKLSLASVKHPGNPYGVKATWPKKLDPEQDWHFAPELISLYGTETYENLDENRKKKLSFLEAVNFYSLNVHGEKALIEGLAKRLYRKWPAQISEYIHHFLGEENNHMILFGSFCMQYAGKIYPDKKMNFPQEFVPGEADFLFFAKVLIFEEIVDYFNAKNGSDARLHPVSKEINRLHRLDESRHLVFGRQIVVDLFKHYASQWPSETLAKTRAYLASYITTTLREYVNPEVYRDLGLEDPYAAMEISWSSPAALSRRKEITAKLVQTLMKNEILLEAPEL